VAKLTGKGISTEQRVKQELMAWQERQGFTFAALAVYYRALRFWNSSQS
jgi:hypothetical protein